MTQSYSAQGSYLFNRCYQVAITPPGSTTALVYGTEGALRSPLRVTFEIERTLRSSANKASISLLNLTLQNRQALGKNSLVSVRAGYQGQVATIFIGYCAKIKTERSGPDIVTTLECGDGEPYITYATLDRSYTEPVSLAQVLQDVADAMQVNFGGQSQAPTPGIVKGIPAKTYNRGIHLTGSCRNILDKLLHPLKIDWSVQNGQLSILPRGAPNIASVTVLSTSTGLVGIPSENADFVGFQSLLNPQIVPGGLVQLVSANAALSAYYKLRKVKYLGDSHGGDWVADCEGVKLDQPFKVIPSAVGMNYSKAVTP